MKNPAGAGWATEMLRSSLPRLICNPHRLVAHVAQEKASACVAAVHMPINSRSLAAFNDVDVRRAGVFRIDPDVVRAFWVIAYSSALAHDSSPNDCASLIAYSASATLRIHS